MLQIRLRLSRLLLQSPKRRSDLNVVVACVLLTFSGCSGWQKSHLAAIHQFDAGRLKESQQNLEKSRKYVRAEKDLLELDQAVLDLASGNPASAENRLRTVRRQLDFLAQKDVAEQATSMLTDDRAQAFSGRPFERQMTLNLLLLSSLMTNGQDAFAYTMQAGEQAGSQKQLLAEAARKKQDPADGSVGRAKVIPAGFEQPAEIPSKLAPSAADQTYALSAYLSAAVQSEIPSRYQETDQALRDLALWNPEFSRTLQSPVTGELGTRCKPGHGAVHVLVLAGHAPEWVPETAAPTTVSLLIADRILSVAGKHTLPPTIAPVQIARPQPAWPSGISSTVRCQISPAAASDAGLPTTLAFHTIVDMNAVAEASYQEHRDEEIARAVTRRIVKKGTVYALKEAQKISNNTAVDLAVNLAGIAWEALEKPDTRSWRLLPARVDVARMELPAGQWTVRLNLPGVSHSGSRCSVPVHIDNGRNTFIVCFVSSNRITGNALIGGADTGTIPVE